MSDTNQDTIRLQIPPWPEMTGASFRYFLQNERHINRICNHYVLIFMLERTLLFYEGHEEVVLNKGEWYVQRPGLMQQGISGCPAPSYFYIHFAAQEAVATDQFNKVLYSEEGSTWIELLRQGFFDRKYLLPFFEQLDYCYKTKPNDLLSIQSVFLTILNSITLHPSQVAGGLGHEITGYLSEHYNQDIRCDTLLKEFHFSTEYINRKVKQYSGMTPVQYLQQIRITRAKELLANTDHTLSHIAAEVGYHDISVFYKAFYKLSGIAPGEYRKKSRKL